MKRRTTKITKPKKAAVKKESPMKKVVLEFLPGKLVTIRFKDTSKKVTGIAFCSSDDDGPYPWGIRLAEIGTGKVWSIDSPWQVVGVHDISRIIIV